MPHCLKEFHDTWKSAPIMSSTMSQPDSWTISRQECPACDRPIIHLTNGSPGINWIVFPKATARPVSKAVPSELALDFREACLTLTDSPKASAALGRRCLQHLLRDYATVKKGDLATEIQELLDRKTLPSHISEAIDAVRNHGNFAAHPMKSAQSGTILDVEPGEAEWTLDVLEALFDFYFVAPAILAAKKAALNKKLAEAAKPPMKS